MDVNKYIGSKIKEFRTRKNIGQEELAEFLNTTSQTISRYELGQRKTGNDILFDLAEYFNVSINDFFPPTTFDNGELIDISDDTIQIPVLGTIKAGIPIEAQQEILEYVEIPKKWTAGGKKFYGLKISGDSMFPKYQEGDIVIFEQNEDKETYNGKDCAVMVNGDDATFKKVLLSDSGITLVPYNTARYEMMMYSNDDIANLPIRIIGIAREKRTKL